MNCARPRISLVPFSVASKADDVLEMAERAKFKLDEWQTYVIQQSLGVMSSGKWAAKRVGVNVPRQNGKGGILELIELTALFTWLPELVGEAPSPPLVIHSAHEFITSQKHSMRVWSLVENTPSLLKQVRNQRMIGTHGQEGFRLAKGDVAIEFRTRTRGGGRGFSCDLLVFDEAMFLPEEALGSLLPTLRARPNPQIWYTGSAADQEVHKECLVWTRLRYDAVNQEPEIAYHEWSLDYEHPDEIPDEVFTSEESMRTSNPAYGIRIFREHFEMELKALDRRTAAVELYGVGDYPDPTGQEDRPISVEQWVNCTDKDSQIVGPICVGYDVSPERRTSIAVAGRNQEGKWQTEVIEKLPGTAWLPAKLADLIAAQDPEMIVADKLGPGASASTIAKMEEAGVTVTLVDGAMHAQACASLAEEIQADNFRHLGSQDLLNAIRAAKPRKFGDRWLWARRSSTADIAPLVAATLALWGAMGMPEGSGDGVFVY